MALSSRDLRGSSLPSTYNPCSSCCKCNGSGVCRNCLCKQFGKMCTNCQPSRRNRGCNLSHADSLNNQEYSRSDSNSVPSKTPLSADLQLPPADSALPLTSSSPHFVPTPADPQPLSTTDFLPPFVPASNSQFTWGECDSSTFTPLLD